jgi:hypothetical protein
MCRPAPSAAILAGISCEMSLSRHIADGDADVGPLSRSTHHGIPIAGVTRRYRSHLFSELSLPGFPN